MQTIVTLCNIHKHPEIQSGFTAHTITYPAKQCSVVDSWTMWGLYPTNNADNVCSSGGREVHSAGGQIKFTAANRKNGGLFLIWNEKWKKQKRAAGLLCGPAGRRNFKHNVCLSFLTECTHTFFMGTCLSQPILVKHCHCQRSWTPVCLTCTGTAQVETPLGRGPPPLESLESFGWRRSRPIPGPRERTCDGHVPWS